MNRTNDIPLLIAGAGPTGLVMALWLKRRGIRFRIIDKSAGPGQTSRALAIQARTLEFYGQLGIADSLIAAGITVPEIVMRRNGQVVARAKIGAMGKDLSPYPYLLFCSQDVHEALLCEVLRNEGVEIERETELCEFQQTPDGVIARLKGPQGEESLKADFLCGADGAHSIVRHMMPTEFPGGAYSQVFFVADVAAQGEMAQAGVQISLSKNGFCIVMPIRSQGSIRLTGIVPRESETKEKITFDDVSASVKENTGLSVSKVNWFSSYFVHHRVARNFQKGRVFIAGDAGHIHSPVGGQGMNTGIGDAVNLAWKLADVIDGRASAEILKTYETERHAFANVLIRTTDRAFKIIANRGFLGSFFRAYLLPIIFAAATRFRVIVKFMFRAVSQIRIRYRNSALSQGVAGRVSAGDRLPWLEIDDDSNYSPLRSLEWQVHVYGTVQESFKKELRIPVYEFQWSERAAKAGFAKNAAYVVRPDGYVGLASDQSADALRTYFERFAFTELP